MKHSKYALLIFVLMTSIRSLADSVVMSTPTKSFVKTLDPQAGSGIRAGKCHRRHN